MDKEWLGQGKSDPYAILRITSDGEMSTFKTSVIDNSLHPVWNMSGTASHFSVSRKHEELTLDQFDVQKFIIPETLRKMD